MRPPIFNDYDEHGFRTNSNGNRTSRIEDETIVSNLRYRWPSELEAISDQALVNTYDQFSLSVDFGDNDAKFLDWI